MSARKTTGRTLYEVKFRKFNGDVAIFNTKARSPKQAGEKLKSPGRVISVKKAY